MTISRIAPLLWTRRALPTALLGTGAAVTAVSGAWMLQSPTTNNTLCNDSGAVWNLADSQQQRLVIPTLEASLRAMRLVGTAVRIVADYQIMTKLEKTKQRLLPSLFSIPEDVSEISKLEAEVERNETRLEELQIAYSRGTGSTDATRNLSVEERIELQKQQKQKMQDAAAELAAAEEKLVAAVDAVDENADGDADDSGSKSRLHRTSAERLLRLCRENGGVYIKVGQHLANLDYLIPREYIEVLSSLFNDAPQSDIKDVYKVIEEDLGRSPDELFERFDPNPIASASLAQVHVAYCKKTKTKLAVKVQHRGLRETSAGDLFAVTTVVRLIDSWFPDFTFGWIADEMAPQLPKELDFQREGRNAEKAAKHIEQSGLPCCIPTVLWENTSPRVLTMEFEEGFKSTDVEALEASGLKKSDVARLVSSVFNSQVFHSGFVHCDPHPGNCLIRRSKTTGKPEMVLVDHGLYKTLDDDFRITYAELWRSLMMADLEGIQSACSRLGVDEMYPLFAAMLTARPYDEIIERSRTGSLSSNSVSSNAGVGSQADKAVIRGYAKQFLGDIVSLLGILPPQMLLLLKMNDCLRHIDMALESPTNTLVIAGRYASRAVYDDRIRRMNRVKRRRTTTTSGEEEEQSDSGDGGDRGNGNASSSSSPLTVTKRSVLRVRYWWDYTRVLVRIRIHDVGAWILTAYHGLRG